MYNGNGSYIIQIPGIVDQGLPIQHRAADYIAQIGRTATPFTELGGDGSASEFTLSEAIERTAWDNLLPDSKIFAKYVKKKLTDPMTKFNQWSNITNAVAGILFSLGVTGIFYKFIYSVSDKNLRNKDHHSEHIRLFTYGLFCLASALVSFSSALNGYLSLRKKKKIVAEKYKFIMEDYERLRKDFISKHNLTYAFFAITEIIFELRHFPFSDQNYLNYYKAIELKLTKIFQKIAVPFNLPTISAEATKEQLDNHILNIIYRLKSIILSREFNYVTDKIKKYVKQNAFGLRNQSILHPSAVKIRADFDYNVDTDFYTQCMIIDAIGELACIKVRSGTSSLLTAVKLLEESTLDSIKDALIEYWNSPEVKLPLVHPYDVYLAEFAVIINAQIRERLPSLMIYGCPEPVPKPLYLPRGSYSDPRNIVTKLTRSPPVLRRGPTSSMVPAMAQQLRVDEIPYGDAVTHMTGPHN